MNLKQLFDDDRAVSPVIGVILMVAITVILAAVIGTFVLGLGDKVSTTTPSASFQFDYTRDSTIGATSDDSLEITHAGGDTISGQNLNISASNVINESSGNTLTFTTDAFTGEVTAGTTYPVPVDAAAWGSPANDPDVAFNQATIRVVWTSSGGDSSAVLGKWTGPDAS